MAYREIATGKTLEVLRRVARGEERRAVAPVTGHGRATVDRDVRAAQALGWRSDGPAPDLLFSYGVIGGGTAS